LIVLEIKKVLCGHFIGKKLLLLFGNCLNEEVLVVAEKEKTSA